MSVRGIFSLRFYLLIEIAYVFNEVSASVFYALVSGVHYSLVIEGDNLCGVVGFSDLFVEVFWVISRDLGGTRQEQAGS